MKTRSWAFYVLSIMLIVFYLGVFCPNAVEASNLYDYDEECLHEGCNNEEVSELYSSYNEECLHEGCSKEEVVELGGSPSGAAALLTAFQNHGWAVNINDFQYLYNSYFYDFREDFQNFGNFYPT